MVILILKILISIYIMWKVSSSFDLAASYLTRKIGEGIKGPTINAIASSLPELIISSMFLFYYKDIEGFSAGYATIIGSSAFNIACIPIISFFVVSYKKKVNNFNIDKSIVLQDSIFLIISIIVLFFGFIIGMNKFISILLISLYICYIFFVYKYRKNKPNNASKQIIILNKKFKKGNDSYLKSIVEIKIFNIFFLSSLNKFNSYFVVLISIILIGSSCWLLIEAVETISKIYNINLFITAFLIAAISSSVPDTILSIKDAENEKFEDSFSNSYGSNIFDICIGIGLPVLIYSIMYGPIDTNIPIESLGLINFGDNFLNGNLLIWSVISLFIFTIIISTIYYFNKINIKNSLIIFSIYLLFILSLICY
jgi:Ca2+/Na+ antiporter